MAESKKETVPEDVRVEEGSALQRLIDQRGENQKILAEKSGVGSKGFIWQLTKGMRPINLDAAVRIATALGVVIDDFSPRLAQLARQAAKCVRESAPYPAGDGPVTVITVEERMARIDDRGWPFKNLTRAQYLSISDEARSELEAIAWGMAIQAEKQGKTEAA